MKLFLVIKKILYIFGGICIFFISLSPVAFFTTPDNRSYLIWGWMSPFCWPLIGLGIFLTFAPFLKKVRELLPWLILGTASLAFILPWILNLIISDPVPYYEFWYQTDLPEWEQLDVEGMGVYIQVPLAAILIFSALSFLIIRWLFKKTSVRQKNSNSSKEFHG